MKMFQKYIIGFVSIIGCFISISISIAQSQYRESVADSISFKVGLSLPLTGAWAEYGVAVRNGIELAKQDYPELFKNITFLYEDDHYDPKAAVGVFNKLVDLEQIDLFYVWGNESALAIAPIAEKREIPTVVVSQHPASGKGYQYLIRFINPAEDLAIATLKYFRKLNIKGISLVKSEVSIFNILADELKNNLAGDEQLEIYDSFLPNDLDFKTSIAKLKKREMDILGLYLTPPQLVQFLRQAKEQNFKPKLFGFTPFENQLTLKNVVNELDGAFFPQLNVQEDFIRRYVQEYNDDTQITYAANAYQFAIIVGKLFNDHDKNFSNTEVISAFRNIPEGDSPNGHYQFKTSDKSGQYFEFPVVIRRFEQGRLNSIEVK